MKQQQVRGTRPPSQNSGSSASASRNTNQNSQLNSSQQIQRVHSQFSFASASGAKPPQLPAGYSTSKQQTEVPLCERIKTGGATRSTDRKNANMPKQYDENNNSGLVNIENDYYIPSRQVQAASPNHNNSSTLETPPGYRFRTQNTLPLPGAGFEATMSYPFRMSIKSSPSTRITQRQVDVRSVEYLEQALRQETIANEEQRNYIQILKNVIESKMERDGILDLLNDCRMNNPVRADHDYQTFGQQKRPDHAQTFLSIIELKNRIDQQNSQITQLNQQLQSTSESLLQQQEQHQIDQQKIEEQQNLLESQEHEKNELLDCLDQQMQRQASQDAKDFKSLDKEHQQVCAQIDDLNKENVKQLTTIQFQEKKIASLQAELQVAKVQIKEKQSENIQISENASQNEQKVKSLELTICKLEKRLELKDIEGQELISAVYKSHQQLNTTQVDNIRQQDDIQRDLQRKVREQMMEITALSDMVEHAKQTETIQLRQTSKLQQETQLRTSQVESLREQLQLVQNERKQLRIELDNAIGECDLLKQQMEVKNESLRVEMQQKVLLTQEKNKQQEEISGMISDNKLKEVERQAELTANQVRIEALSQENDQFKRQQKTYNQSYQALQSQFTTCQQELKQLQMTHEYLQASNNKVILEMEQIQERSDKLSRIEKSLQMKVIDLEQENQTLFRLQDSYQKLSLDFETQRVQLKRHDQEVERLQTQLRDQKTQLSDTLHDASTLRKQHSQIEHERQKLVEQKNQISCQGIESERRVYDLQRQVQDLQYQANQAVVNCRNAEDNQKQMSLINERMASEIQSLDQESRKLRARVSDSCLIEEKIERVIGDLDQQVGGARVLCTKLLQQLTSRVQISNSLMNLMGIKRREQALIHISKLTMQPPSADSQNDVWSQIRLMTDQSSSLVKALEYVTSINEILTEGYIDAASSELKHTRHIQMLESRICNTTVVDYDTEQRYNKLKQETEQREREYESERLKWSGQVEELQYTLKQTLNQTNKRDTDLTKFEQKIKLLTQESHRLQSLVNKVISYFRGTPIESTLEQMLTCTISIARTETQIEEREMLNERLESDLRQEVNAEGDRMPFIQQLRKQIQVRQGELKDLHETIEFEKSKLRHFEKTLQDQRVNLFGMTRQSSQQIVVQLDPTQIPTREHRDSAVDTKNLNMTQSMEMLLQESRSLRKRLNEKDQLIETFNLRQ